MKEEEELIATTKSDEKCYTGMPITTVVLIFPLVYVLSFVLGEQGQNIFLAVCSSAYVLCGALFILPFRIKKSGLAGVMLMVGIGVIEAIVVLASLVFLRQ